MFKNGFLHIYVKMRIRMIISPFPTYNLYKKKYKKN